MPELAYYDCTVCLLWEVDALVEIVTPILNFRSKFLQLSKVHSKVHYCSQRFSIDSSEFSESASYKYKLVKSTIVLSHYIVASVSFCDKNNSTAMHLSYAI